MSGDILPNTIPERGIVGDLTGAIIELKDESDNESIATCDIEVNYFEENGFAALHDFINGEPPENLLSPEECFKDGEEDRIYKKYWDERTKMFDRLGCPDFAVNDINNYDLYCKVIDIYDLCILVNKAEDPKLIKKLSRKIRIRLIMAFVIRDFVYDDGFDQEWEDEYYGRA